MSQTETAQAAADLTASILAEAAQNLAGDPAGDNAARMLNEMRPGQVVAASQTPAVSSPTPAAEAAPEPPAPSSEPELAPVEPAAVELPNLEPQLDPDYAALLEEPEFEEEAAAEIAAEAEENGYDETFDTDSARKIRELEKRNVWLQEQNVKANKGKWVAEAKRAFPIFQEFPRIAAELDTVTATSRRGFAREAQKLSVKYTEILGPTLSEAAAKIDAARTQTQAEVRAEASQQWGLPVTEPAGSAGISEQERALIKAREDRLPLTERFKIMFGAPTK